jgi:hypothetical protein
MKNINQLMIHKLKDIGAAFVVIEYSGGGDSGAIESVDCLDSKKTTIDMSNFENYSELKEILKDIENYFDITTLTSIEDWWNDDGGWGNLTLDLSDLSYTIENNINYTQTDVYHHEGNISEQIDKI